VPTCALRTPKSFWYTGFSQRLFVVVDDRLVVDPVGPMKPGELNVYLWRDGFHLFFPMPGRDRWRVIGILPEQFRARENVTFESLIPSIRHEAATALDFRSCDWFSIYRIAHRAAERFRDRRCFLLGDAAHIHSPMGGQGMNTGLQDAYNLAWKLALVVGGCAEPELLDTYEQERMPVAHRLLQTTDRAFQFVVADHWFARLMRTRLIGRVAARAMLFDRVRKLAFRTLSQTGISYPKSALSRSASKLPKGAPNAGDRFPWLMLKMQPFGRPIDVFNKLDDRRFNLLVFGVRDRSAELESLRHLVTPWFIPDDAENRAKLERNGIPAESFFLVRPDGHIGLCGSAASAAVVRDYMSACVKLRDSTYGNWHPGPAGHGQAVASELSTRNVAM
jgi:FAD binding domain